MKWGLRRKKPADASRMPQLSPEQNRNFERMNDLDLTALLERFGMRCWRCGSYGKCFEPIANDQQQHDGRPTVTIHIGCDIQKKYAIRRAAAQYMAGKQEGRQEKEPLHCGMSWDYTLTIPDTGTTIHFSFPRKMRPIDEAMRVIQY